MNPICQRSIEGELVPLLVPNPGGADDVVELCVARLPAKLLGGLFGAGNKDRGIAGATGMEFSRDGVTGDAASGFDDFADAESLAVAEVVDEAGLLGGIGIEGPESEDMSFSKVRDVDVVADAGAVGCGVVVAVDAYGLTAAEGDVQDERDEV